MPDYNESQPGVVSVGSNAIIDHNQDELPQIDPAISEKRAALLYEHPDYCAKKEKWRKYSHCYEADDIYQYIHRHSRESEDIFEKRVARGYYYNYVASVIDLFVAYLYHAPITRSPEGLPTEDYNSFLENCNFQGDTYHIFMQMAETFAMLHGHVGILVDVPKEPNPLFTSEEERQKANHRPYLVLIQAIQILDWKLDFFGKFDWVKIEIFPDEDRDYNEQVDRGIRYILIWRKDSWEKWKVPAEEDEEPILIGEGENTIGEVPIVVLRSERCITDRWMGLSTVRDIADINLAILNWSSLGDEEIYERCLNVLTMERSDTDATALISHYNVLEFESGAERPEYLTPGTSPLDLISKWIDRGRDEIYRLAKLGGTSGVKTSKEAVSGIAYAYEFNETNQSLSKKAESVEQAEIEIHRLFGKWFRKEFTGNIQYPREFGVDDFIMELQILAEARTTITSETAIREIESRLVRKLFARNEQSLRDKIVREIQAANPKGQDLLAEFSSPPTQSRLLGGGSETEASPS